MTPKTRSKIYHTASRLACVLLGHRIINDPVGRPFSTRMRICTRCHRSTSPTRIS